MSRDQIYGYFEHLGCRAAREGKKDAERRALGLAARLAGGDGRSRTLDHLKTEDIDTEPFLFRKRTQQEIADYDAGFKARLKGSGSDEGKSFVWYRGWAEAQE